MTNKYVKDSSNQFNNKIVVVTGSTQGSGAETAKLLAHRGAKGIVICGRNEKKGNKVKKEIELIGTKCVYVKADLENLKDCNKIISQTLKKFGTINSLINCAAYTGRGTILSTTPKDFERMFNVNTRAPFFLMQEAIKIMIKNKVKGTIAHILSVAAYSGMPFLAAYSPSKAALGIMIKNVANAVSGHQIRVNGINLGWTDTPAEHDVQKKYHNAKKDSEEISEVYISNDKTVLERRPLEKISSINQMCAFKHEGFWQCMDNIRDKALLENLIKNRKKLW